MSVRAWVEKSLGRVPSASSAGAWGWLGAITEHFTGEFQTEVRPDPPATLLRLSAVFSCVSGISSDVAKLRLKLSKDEGGIWSEIMGGSPYLPVLRKPNHYQNRMQFVEQWLVSKLLTGNAYILLDRDGRGGEGNGVVRAMYPLDPLRTWPLVTESGDVYYQLASDPLSRVAADSVVVPADRIVHDRYNCMWHPLVGISPLYATAYSGTLANKIITSSSRFFANRAMPGGILTAPGHISDKDVQRLKEGFQRLFGGENQGNVAVLGDSMKFEPVQMTAQAAQIAEQLKLSVEDVARAFHYPQFKLGGQLPTTAGGVEAIIITYYTDCLQQYVEALELCLDEGLGLSGGLHVELDMDGLMRMDTAAMFAANNQAVGGGWMKPNEARHKANLPPVEGGDTPYLQQQNYSLAALDRRDRRDPFGSATPEPRPVSELVVSPAPEEKDAAKALQTMMEAVRSRVSKGAGHAVQ